MDHLDWSHRWVYKGSKTIPPCEKFVYWNVIDTVYPLEATSLKLFEEKLKEGGIIAGNGAGNYREIQKGFNPDVVYVTKTGATHIFASTFAIFSAIYYLY